MVNVKLGNEMRKMYAACNVHHITSVGQRQKTLPRSNTMNLTSFSPEIIFKQ